MSEWKKVKIGEFLKRYKEPVEIQDSIEYKQVTIRTNHQGIELRKRQIGKKIGTKKQFIIHTGQFLMSKIDARYGAFGIVPEELEDAIITGNFWAYEVDQNILNINYFNQYTNSPSFYELCERSSSGITHRKYLQEEKFLNFEIEIPIDIKAQEILLSNITSFSTKIYSLKHGNELQMNSIQSLRQQILQDAITGKLSEQWRKENPDVESAEILLQKIKAEKEKLVTEGKIRKQKELPSIQEDEIPFELPNGWVWCRLGDICFKITDGFHNTPPKVSDGFPYIAATHIKSDKIYWSGCNYVAEKFHRELFLKATPQKGEILVVNIGAGCGTPAIIDVDFEFSFKNTAILKFDQSEIYNKYVYYYFVLKRNDFYNDLTKGGLQPFLSLKILNDIIFPLPPLSEQHHIVERIEYLFAKLDRIKELNIDNQNKIDLLNQVVLNEMFKDE